MSMSQLVALATWLGLTVTRRAAARIVLGLPATMAHELAHWTVALLVGSRPGLPSFWPRREQDQWVLGSVAFRPRPLTAGAVALAPLWCFAPAVAWLLSSDAAFENVFQQAVKGVLAGYLAVAAIPSAQDWLIAARYPVGSSVVVAAMVLGARAALGA